MTVNDSYKYQLLLPVISTLTVTEKVTETLTVKATVRETLTEKIKVTFNNSQ